MKCVYTLLTCFITFLVLGGLYAQETTAADSLELDFKPYGSFRGHFAIYDNEVEFQENASRIGLELGVTKSKIRFFAGVELRVNLFKSNSQFNSDGNSAGGFLVAELDQANQVFSSRLGYLGFDMSHWGKLSFGKQWSVYYDVTSYTDKFNVFGGRGSATYVAGTDGGEIGTGRADQALVYRNKIGRFSFGFQLQAKNATNDKFIDGVGASLQIDLIKYLKVGFAFNRGNLNDALLDEDTFLGINGQPTYYTLGLSYESDNLILGAVYANQTNGDLTQGRLIIPDMAEQRPSVVYNAYGFELFGKYYYEDFAFIAGYNYYQPDIDEIERPGEQLPVDEGFGINDIILGLEYRPTRIAYFYAEGRITNSKTSFGTRFPDVLTLGIRIELDKVFTSRIKI